MAQIRLAVIATTGALVLGSAATTASAAPHEDTRAARTYVVNSTKDTVDADVGVGACADAHKKCSLRAAIMQANFHPGPDVVKLPAGHFRLTRKGDDDVDVLGDLDVTDSITLRGAGPGRTTIDGNGKVTHDRVLQVFPTAIDTTITGLTIRGGHLPNVFPSTGGGLWWHGSSQGHLLLEHVTVSHNLSYYSGGMVLSAMGTFDDSVTLDHVTVAHNRATTAAAGGLDVELGSFETFTLRDSVIHANRAYEGAGLYVGGPTSGSDPTSARVEHTVFSDNHASGLSGGLEYHGGSKTAVLTVAMSYLHDNRADIQGGGIGNFYGDLQVTQSTLEGNTAGMKGGALYDYEGALATFTNTTLSANTATDTGGGAFVEFFGTTGGSVRFVQSTLSGNNAATGAGGYAQAGATLAMTNTVIAHGASGANCVGNLGGQTSVSDDNSCGFAAGGGLDAADLKLGPIGWHGGPTRTLVPRAGSEALDIGTVAGEPPIDQRGVSRPEGTGQDVGSVEVCPIAPSPPTRVKASQKGKGRHLTLHWVAAGCWQTFSVAVRQHSPHGKVVESKKHLLVPKLRTRTLAHGHRYSWRVTIVGDRGNASSTWHHIRLT